MSAPCCCRGSMEAADAATLDRRHEQVVTWQKVA